MRREQAQYHEAILPEHRGNPMIEALPPKASEKTIMDSFSHYPELDEHIRQCNDPLVREEYTVRLKALRQPLPIYYDCFRAIEMAIKDGYSSRNPFSPTTQQYLHYPIDEIPAIEPITGFFEPKGDGMTLIGESGVGKSSMLEQILNYFPSVIKHHCYQGKEMQHRNQIVWLKVDCPNNSSVRDLCEEILASIDIVSGHPPTRPDSTIGKLMRQIEQRIKSNFLGILVIDEMQRLVLKRTRGENNLLNFLHSLVNKLGIPVFFCANPPFDNTLAKTLKAARRAESGGYFEMEPLTRESDAWDCFVNELWDLHWTNVTTKLTTELNDKLHELSAGNLDLAHRTYRDAQKLVIGTDDERITTAVLEHAYISACALSSRTEEIKVRRRALSLPRRQTVKSKSKTAQSIEKKHQPIGDVSRPQHPEFALQLRELYNDINILAKIPDPDLVRRASDEDDPLSYLEKKSILSSDPLKQFS